MGATKVCTLGKQVAHILLECCLVSLSFHQELQCSTLEVVIHLTKCNCNVYRKRQRNAVEIVNVVHDVKQLVLFREFPFLDLHFFFKLSVSLVVNYIDIRNPFVSSVLCPLPSLNNVQNTFISCNILFMPVTGRVLSHKNTLFSLY